MSKFGWDLPPGCSSSDIPGNRREDIEQERIYDAICGALKPLNLEEDDKFETVLENLAELINKAHEIGYAQCTSDMDEARAYNALKHCDDARLDDDRQQENEKRIRDES